MQRAKADDGAEILRTLRSVRQALAEMVALAEASIETYGATDLETDQIGRAHIALEALEGEIRVRE